MTQLIHSLDLETRGGITQRKGVA